MRFMKHIRFKPKPKFMDQFLDAHKKFVRKDIWQRHLQHIIRCCQRNSSWSLSTTIRDHYEAQSWNHSERAAQRVSL
jgi:hypothetical protein